MKKLVKTVAVLVAIAVVLPVAVALAEADTISGYQYNEHDLSVVQSFLEQEVNGKKNGVVLYGEKYNVNDPTTWLIDEEQYPGYWRELRSGIAAPSCFSFDDGGYLVSVNFGYYYSEEINGVHADGIRFFPVSGDLVFEDCKRLENVICDNTFNKVVITGASPRFRYGSYFSVYSASEVYLPVPFGIGYISFKSAYSAITAVRHREGENRDDILSVTAAEYANNDNSNSFIGWVNRVTGDMYSTERTIDIAIDKVDNNFTCILEAVYEKSPAFTPETDDKMIPVGDANNDMHINTGDAAAILKSTVGLAVDSYQEILADVNRDGLVNTGDAVEVLKLCAGLK